MFSDIPVTYFGCTHRSIAPKETIKRVESKLKAAGITRIAEITHLDRLGIPVYSAIRPSAEEGSVSIYAGKGATKTQAKASAMMEGFERYSAEIQKEDLSKKFINGTFNDLENSINPRSLILPQISFDAEKTELSWVKAIDAKTDEEFLVPANAVYHPFNMRDNFSLFKSNTNGLASGNELEEAIFHGMLEVIERDAWSLFEAKRESKTEIDCSDSKNSIIKDLLSKFQNKGVNVKLVDLTADIKATTIAAVADDTVLKDPALLTLGVGTHLDPEIAAIRALTEVAQSRATQIHGTREDTVRAVFMRKAGYERMKRINKHWFGESEKIVSLDKIRNRSSKSFKTDIENTLKLLAKEGFKRVLFVDLSREEIDIPVVRVIIPKLEVFSVDPERRGKRLFNKTLT
ncbi:MAG: YcaO-related McrA-glycine thioamidation protein [Methanobacteriaceae archaeon]